VGVDVLPGDLVALDQRAPEQLVGEACIVGPAVVEMIALGRAAANQRGTLPGFGLSMGLTLTWLSIIVLIPLAGLFLKTFELSFDQFWAIVSSRLLRRALPSTGLWQRL